MPRKTPVPEASDPQWEIIYEDGPDKMPSEWTELFEGHYVFDAAVIHWNGLGHVALERRFHEHPSISVCRLNVTTAHADLWLLHGIYRIAPINVRNVHAELKRLGEING